MSQFFPFLIVGLVAGSIYGMTAVGLVLTYRTSGIFNFGHGAIAAANAFIFYELREQWGLPWPLALLVCLVVLAPMMGFVLERMAKALSTATTAAKVVATVGLLVGIQGLLVASFGADTRQFKAIFPTHVLSLGNVNVGVDQLLTLGIALAITGLLAGFLARSRLGVAVRGVVDDPDLVNLSGTNPAQVRRASWAMGSSVAALSGILIAPTLGLDAVLLTYLVIQAFGAAAIGRFASIPRTFAGGLVVGVGASLATKYVGQIHWLSGFPPSFPFIVLFLVLLFTRRGRFIELGASATRVAQRQRAPLPAPLRRAVGLVLAVAVLAVPSFTGVHLSSYADTVIFVLIFASLRLLVVTSGQVSLCQAAFAAVGATTFSHLAVDQHLPWLIALLISGLVAVPVGAVLAVPAIRLSGLYLALATFGFGVLLQRLIYPTALMFGSKASLAATRPSIGGLHLTSDKAFYFVCVAVVAAGVGLVHLLTRTRLGRLLRALSDSPTALTTLGAEVNLIRTLVFCISAALAAIAGALYASFIGSFGPSSFDALLSLTLLVVLAIAVGGELSTPIIAAIAYVLVPSYIQSSALNEWLPVLFGLSAVLVAVNSAKTGPAPSLLRVPERIASRGRASPVRYRLQGATANAPMDGPARTPRLEGAAAARTPSLERSPSTP